MQKNTLMNNYATLDHNSMTYIPGRNNESTVIYDHKNKISLDWDREDGKVIISNRTMF